MQGDGERTGSNGPDELDRWFDLSSELLCVFDANGFFVRVSRSWTRTLGYSVEELTARPFLEFVHPDDRLGTAQRLASWEATGVNPSSFVNRYLHADGSSRWLEWSPQTRTAGGVVYAAARDITALRRHRNEQASLSAAWMAVAAGQSLDEILDVVTDQARGLIGTRSAATTLTAGPEWARAKEDRPSGAGSQLAMPLIDRDGAALGQIVLTDKIDGSSFDADDARQLEAFSRIAALTIERALAHDEAGTALAQQKLVVGLGQATLSGQPLQHVLDEAVAAVAAMLAITTVAVLEVDERDGVVTLTPVARVPDTLLPVDHTPERFSGMTPGRALATGVPAVLEDVAELGEMLAAETVERYGIRSACAVPMIDPSTFRGVLQAADARPRRFGDVEIAFLQQVANVLSSAIAHARTQERLLHQATHDALTGLPNRTMFRAALDEGITAALERRGATGLLLLDVDGFKDVNDSLGHSAGDQVLEQLAGRLAAAAGEGSLVARLGGDEFAVCIPGLATGEQLEEAAERLGRALDPPFELDGLAVPLSASIGIVAAPEHGADASTLLRRADVAMYRAKAERSGWARYEERLDHARAIRLTSIAELRDGIRAGDLEVHYQPIVDMEESRVTEVEALVRWRHPVRGLVAPADFIALAEHSGLIGELTAAVIEQAVVHAGAWRRAGRELRCAVNLSVAALTYSSVADELLASIVASRDLLSVEITESALADSRAQRTLRDLAGAGVSCAIDDFGTGYSSLAALSSLPVDTLKIDRAFVLDIDRSDQAFAVIRSVVQLADALTLHVIAEGVETAQIAGRLQQAGIRLAQGYLYARPMPAADVVPWLDSYAQGRLATAP